MGRRVIIFSRVTGVLLSGSEITSDLHVSETCTLGAEHCACMTLCHCACMTLCHCVCMILCHCGYLFGFVAIW